MKIVFLSPGAKGGGAEAALFDLVTGLKRKNPTWELSVLFGEEGPLIARMVEHSILVERLYFPVSLQKLGEQAGLAGGVKRLLSSAQAAISFALYVLKVRRRLSEIGPQIVYSNGMKMHFVSRFALPFGSSLVWHIHDYLGQRRISARLLPWLAGGVRLMIANSADVARDAQLLFPKNQIDVLENPVDTAHFSPNGPRSDLDGLSGFTKPAEPCLKIGLMATFAKWKGQQLFLQAIHLLPKGLPVRFYVIGGPIYATSGSQWTREELVSNAARLDYPVGFPGWADDAAAALRSLDIFVHASTTPEPFGLVITQAMACGRALIVSGEGGAAGLVRDHPQAGIFTPRDPKSLSEAILDLIHNPEKRSQSLITGPQIVEKRFSEACIVGELTTYLSSLSN